MLSSPPWADTSPAGVKTNAAIAPTPPSGTRSRGHPEVTEMRQALVGMSNALRLMTLVRLRPAVVARSGSVPVLMPKPVVTRTSA
jgi:hypothetical protein